GFDVLLLQGTGAIEVDLDAASDLTTGDIAVVRNFEGASGANFSGQLTLRGREAAGDRLEGGAGTNRLFGRGGNDTLVATGFGDELDGGAGDDVVQINPQALVAVGGAGNDTLVLTSTNVIAAIDLAAGNHNTGSGGPVLTTFEHVDGTAATQSLTLRGTGGANALSG